MFPLVESQIVDFRLNLLIFSPLLGALVLLFVPRDREKIARYVGVAFSGATFLLSVCLLTSFDAASAEFQFQQQISWMPDLGVRYFVGVDGISLWLIVLTALLSMLVLLSADSVSKAVRGYVGCVLILESGMLGTLVALDAITFYVFWELMLIPMYFLIGVWGGNRRVYAAMKFMLFTAFGSLLMLVAIVYCGYLHFHQFGNISFALSDWVSLRFDPIEEIAVFAVFALAFAIKIPVFPLHTWLPDAHVEAPTGGSVLLAGVLLKLGLYGLIRFGIPVFPYATNVFAPLFVSLGAFGIIFGALVAWVQTDMKKLVAYSSISHLGFCVVGYAVMSFEGLQGCLLQMINHGISTAALFFIVGALYERTHTREISAYGGLAEKVPVFAAVFMVFTLSSIGLPLTNGFVGEFLILFSGFRYSAIVGVVSVLGVVLGAVYMLSLYRRVVFGPVNNEQGHEISDLRLRERVVFAPLVALVFIVGLYPQVILDSTAASSRWYIKYLCAETGSCSAITAPVIQK